MKVLRWLWDALYNAWNLFFPSDEWISQREKWFSDMRSKHEEEE